MGVAGALDSCAPGSRGPKVLGVENQRGPEAHRRGSLAPQKGGRWGFLLSCILGEKGTGFCAMGGAREHRVVDLQGPGSRRQGR